MHKPSIKYSVSQIVPDKDSKEINEIWIDTSDNTLMVAQTSPAPPIHSYQHFKEAGGSSKVKTRQAAINVNYFGASDDGEIGVLKYRTPFSRGIGGGGEHNIESSGNTYILENSTRKKKNHDAVTPSIGALSPYVRSNKDKDNGPVVKIAIPRAMPLPPSPYREGGGSEEGGQSFLDDNPSIATGSIAELNSMARKDELRGDEGPGASTLNPPTTFTEQIMNTTDHTKAVEKNHLEDEALEKETQKVKGAQVVERRSSSRSDYDDRCSSPSELSQGAFVRSSVVVPAVKFLPPQPLGPGLDFPDFGPSRGNPSSQSLSGVSDCFEMPLSNRSLGSHDSLGELSSPAQQLVNSLAIDRTSATRDFLINALENEQSPPTARSQSSIESQSTSKSIRSWVYEHSSLRGSSFTPVATLSTSNRLLERRRRGGGKDFIGGGSSSYHGSSSGVRRGVSVKEKEIWESIDDGSTVKSMETEVRRIPTNQVAGWKLKNQTDFGSSPQGLNKTSLGSSSNASSSPPPARLIDDTRHHIASQRAIRRMRARVGEDLKWQGLDYHLKQLKCCDAAHITHMVSKMDAIDKSSQTKGRLSNKKHGILNGKPKSDPVKLDRINEQEMPTEPYLLHMLSKRKEDHGKVSPSSSRLIESRVDSGGSFMSEEDFRRAQQYFFQSAMDSIDFDSIQQEVEADHARSWAEISTAMENNLNMTAQSSTSPQQERQGTLIGQRVRTS